ncbi:MAG TPA: twin-arginine translocation signal domain-containing protein [Micromonosporaceae bacterium]|nr:twin-arginine translocation signal domain-containing protein [Micromonosporaceae bacterium]
MTDPTRRYVLGYLAALALAGAAGLGVWLT